MYADDHQLFSVVKTANEAHLLTYLLTYLYINDSGHKKCFLSPYLSGVRISGLISVKYMSFSLGQTKLSVISGNIRLSLERGVTVFLFSNAQCWALFLSACNAYS